MPKLTCECGHVVTLTDHARQSLKQLTCPNCGTTRKLKPVALLESATDQASAFSGININSEVPAVPNKQRRPRRLWLFLCAIMAMAVGATFWSPSQPLRIPLADLSPADQHAIKLVRSWIQNDNPKTQWEEIRWFGCREAQECRFCRLKYRQTRRGPLGTFESTHDEVFYVSENTVRQIRDHEQSFAHSVLESMIDWSDDPQPVLGR